MSHTPRTSETTNPTTSVACTATVIFHVVGVVEKEHISHAAPLSSVVYGGAASDILMRVPGLTCQRDASFMFLF